MNEYDQHLTETCATLDRIARGYQPSVFASSLAAEDMVLADIILSKKLPINIFTLNTGRLHAETLSMIRRIKETYGAEIAVLQPDVAAVATYVALHGANGFYDSIEARHECCRIRKVEPLNRALANARAWITGQRRSQATSRAALEVQEFDHAHGIAKFNPLADWSETDVWHYLKSNNVPFNPLHEQGYPSIGCEPCTRAIQPGEDIRAGRWWWEDAGAKECGLHIVDGKLVRIKQA